MHHAAAPQHCLDLSADISAVSQTPKGGLVPTKCVVFVPNQNFDSCIPPLGSMVVYIVFFFSSSTSAQLKQIGTDDGVCLTGSLVHTGCGLKTENRDRADGWQWWKKVSTEETPVPKAVTVTGAKCTLGHVKPKICFGRCYDCIWINYSPSTRSCQSVELVPTQITVTSYSKLTLFEVQHEHWWEGLLSGQEAVNWKLSMKYKLPINSSEGLLWGKRTVFHMG